MGERVALWYLTEKGLRPVASNVELNGGEIDILAMDGATRVAVEVRTRSGAGDPVDAVDPAKRTHAAALARRAGARRFDVIGIGIGPGGFDVHWVPGAS